MWPKNATIFGFDAKAKLNFATVPLFQAPTSSEFGSQGFSAVRDDQLFHTAGNKTLLRFTLAKKHLPSSAVSQLVRQKAAELEEAQGFAPGKKAMKELKERVIDELLPRALSTQSTTSVWLDHAAGILLIDTASNAMADKVLKALLKAFDDLGVEDASWPGQKVINEWLIEDPEGFTVDDEVTLIYPGAQGKTVQFKAANLSEGDVQMHLQKSGASVKNLAMTFDDSVSFVMTDNQLLRRIRPTDVLKNANKEGTPADRFDNDFFLVSMEVARLVKAVQEAA